MTRHISHARRGVSLVYVSAIMVVLIGFLSLAVDIGRVRLAHTELRTAADAAVFAGASCMKDDRDEAAERAYIVAAANSCAGDPIMVFADEDIQFGRWRWYSNTFEPAVNSSSRINALRVIARRVGERDNALPLVFARVLGYSQWDVSAAAVAMITGGRATLGIVGIESLKMTGTSMTDSYNSNDGPYDPANPGDNGDVASNGLIELVGTVDVNGSVHTGPDGDLRAGNNVTITGDEFPFPEPLDYPPVDASPYATDNNNDLLDPSYLTHRGDLWIKANQTYTLPGSDDPDNPMIYYVRNFTVHGTATLDIGPNVHLYVTGNVDISGNVGTNGINPSEFRIFVAGSGTVTLAGQGTTKETHAVIYAPEASVHLKGNHNFYGAVVCRTLNVVGTTQIHYDEALDQEIEWPEQILLVG